MEPDLDLRRAQALDRDRGDDLLQDLGLDRTHHVGADVARADGVDRHALGRQLLRQRHREAVHAGLGRRVVGLPGLALLAVDRRDLDDAAPALLHHVRHHLLGDVEHAVQVGVDDGFQSSGVIFRNMRSRVMPALLTSTSIAPCSALRLGEGGHRAVPVGDVADRGVEGVAQRLLLAQPLVEVAARAAAGDDLEAFLVQALADGGADAAHAAGDVRNFLLHVVSLLRLV
jgi:hypothetical protein